MSSEKIELQLSEIISILKKQANILQSIHNLFGVLNEEYLKESHADGIIPSVPEDKS
jgi:hypothetical protein